MAEDYIWTENMTVGYGKTSLIQQVGIHVRVEEIVTFIGSNGAGESTTPRSVIRRLGLLGGIAYLDNMPMEGMGEREIVKRILILMIEQTHPEPTNCGDVVGTDRCPYTGKMGILTAKDKGKVREAMELVHAWDLTSQDFLRISDGQKQRILLARAVCQSPSVIVLDGLTSFLDIRHKPELLTILKDLIRRERVAALMFLHELNLTQKLSDYIVCIKGEYVGRYGTPEETFTSSYITGLYGITKGGCYTESGCLEMEPVKDKPQIFVIGGDGSGISVYGRLQRMGIPFAAGVLHGNDMDHPIARALAFQVMSEVPLELVREETYDRAAEVLVPCGQVICCLKESDTLNDKNRKLAELGRDRQGVDLLI